MKKLLWGRWDDKDIQNNPHLLHTCLECVGFELSCPFLERITLREYGNAPACSAFKDIAPRCTMFGGINE